jgi:hypothetical protein
VRHLSPFSHSWATVAEALTFDLVSVRCWGQIFALERRQSTGMSLLVAQCVGHERRTFRVLKEVITTLNTSRVLSTTASAGLFCLTGFI